METNDLQKVLEEFTNDDYGKSILIDGPWGCGKTHSILNYIKQNKKSGRNIVYLSLFGYKTIESINKSLYEMTKKFKSFFVNTIKIMPSILSIIPYVNDVVKGLDFQLDIKVNEKVKDRSIIIFDDLERLSLDIDYIELFGYINNLFACGCRVMCLVSSSNIPLEPPNRKKSFDEFKEKVFDRYYIINRTNSEIYDALFNGDRYMHIKPSYNLFNNNIRLARKTKYFIDDIYKRIEGKNCSIKESFYDELTLNNAIIYTVLIVFGKHNEPTIDGDKEYYHLSLKDKYGENIANNYFSLLQRKECANNFEIKGFKKLLESLIDVFIYRNFDSFESIMFRKNESQELDILDKSFFYLTDDGKEDYKKAFIESLQEGSLKWDERGKGVISTLFNDGFPFDDKSIKLISKIVVDSDVQKTPNFLWEFGIIGRTKVKDKEKDFIDKLTYEVSEALSNKFILSFDDICASKDYQKMITFVENIGLLSSPEQEQFKKNFIKKNFYLPDLSVELTHDVWSYAHSIAKFVELNKMDNEFIRYAITECTKNKDNHSLVDRYYALIFYSLHNDNIDEDILTGKKSLEASLLK